MIDKSEMTLARCSAFVGSQLLPALSSKAFLNREATLRGARRHAHLPRRQRSAKVVSLADPAPSSINVPSGVLLALSSVMAISTVGCVFELSSGHPQYGYKLTSFILTVSAPAFLFLFAAAIRKGRAEAGEL